MKLELTAMEVSKLSTWQSTETPCGGLLVRPAGWDKDHVASFQDRFVDPHLSSIAPP